MIKILKKGSKRENTLMAKVCCYCNCVFTFNYLDVHQDINHNPIIKCPQCNAELYPYNHNN